MKQNKSTLKEWIGIQFSEKIIKMVELELKVFLIEICNILKVTYQRDFKATPQKENFSNNFIMRSKKSVWDHK
jgi:hypothetical protein